jgi:hypothetical protein
MVRPRRTTPSSRRLLAPAGRTPVSIDVRFVDRWLASLAPTLRTALLVGIATEAARRVREDPFGSLASEAAELLVAACAEGHGLAAGELRMLIPGIDDECRARMKTSLRCA